MKVKWRTIHKSWNDEAPNRLPNHLWRVNTQITTSDGVGIRLPIKTAWEEWWRS